MAIVQGTGKFSNAPTIYKDQDQSHLSEAQRQAAAVVNHPMFECSAGGVIFLNAVMIGVEQALDLQGNSNQSVMQVIESVFLLIYIVELALRMYSKGLYHWMDDAWLRFDLFFVFSGILTTWILQPMFGVELAAVVIFRIVRLLRVLRTLRLFVKVEEFGMILRGFLSSARALAVIVIMLCMSLYVFGILGVELITKHQLNRGPDADPEFQMHVEEYFANLPVTMLTLLSMACLDDLHEVWNPLVRRDGMLSLYFISLIFVIGIVAMGLVQAVIFATTIEQNANEVIAQQKVYEEEFAHLIKDLQVLFVTADTDNSGTVTLNEFLNLNEYDSQRLCRMLGVKEVVEVFRALDVDGTGEISITGFFNGICDVVLTRGVMDALQLKRMEMQIETMHWRLKKFTQRTEDIVSQFQGIAHDGFMSLQDGGAKAAKKKKDREGGFSLTEAMAPAWATELFHRQQEAILLALRSEMQSGSKEGVDRASSKESMKKTPSDGKAARPKTRRSTSSNSLASLASVDPPKMMGNVAHLGPDLNDVSSVPIGPMLRKVTERAEEEKDDIDSMMGGG